MKTANPDTSFAPASRAITRSAFLLSFLALLLPAVVRGQGAGEIIWSVDLAYTPVTAAPRVSPNGNILVHSENLHAISPTGEILWTQPAFASKAIDVGPDNTVYSGSEHTIFAYTPEGQLIWSFTEPPGGQGLISGPTRGVDGNIYAVTDGGGLGALALTPTGQLIWNTPGYNNGEGTGMTPVPLTSTRLYFAEDTVPGCVKLTQGISALNLDGNLLWCDPISGVERAVATPGGDALVHDLSTLYDYNPDGSIDWSFVFPFKAGTLIGPSVGADGTIYIFHNFSDLWSFTPEGVKRWQSDELTDENFPVRPAISPDGSVVVFGTVFSFGVNGKLVAVDAADGSVLWTLPITGPSAGVAGRLAFSNDGQTVYAPITEIGGINRLLAVKVTGGSSGGPSLNVSGTCPGTVTLTIGSATPNGTVELYQSKRAGSTTLSGGSCAGTTLGLSKARILTARTADANGNVTVQIRPNANRCALLFQAVDLTTCATTNVATGP